MEAKKIFNRRQSFRIDAEIEGYYSLNGRQGIWKKCSVINFSREGTGILFFTSEAIAIGSTIHLKVAASAKSRPIPIKGTLTWIKKEKNGFIGGIKW